MNETINDSCIICFNNIPVESLCKTNCNHIYCKDCLHTWFDRGKIECPMCRLNVRSYENNGIQNHLVVLNTIPENRIVIEANTNNPMVNTDNNMYIRKIKIMKFYICINLVYMGYLHYKNYIQWEECKP